MNKKKNIDLNKLSFQELETKVKDLADAKKQATVKSVGVWDVGKNYFIRTVTMALTGKLVDITDKEFVLEDAAWIADSGRFSDFVKTGKLSTSAEVEPFPEGRVIVGRGGLIDAVPWSHPLPKEQK